MNLIKIITISIAAATLIIIAIIHENSATPETSLSTYSSSNHFLLYDIKEPIHIRLSLLKEIFKKSNFLEESKILWINSNVVYY